MFKVEDYIICGKYGVCKVADIGPISFTGATKKKLYYTLVPIYANTSKNYVPVDNDKVVMRPVISKKEAEELIDRIDEIDALWIGNEKKRELAFKEAIYKYTCEDWITVIKAVYLRKEERTAQGKKVTMNDERYLHLAEDYLYGELAVALGVDRDKVENFIVERVREMQESDN